MTRDSDSGSSRANRKTMVDGSEGLWEGHPPTPSAAFLRYRHKLAEALARGAEGAFVALLDGQNDRLQTDIIKPGRAKILGRHEQCHLALEHASAALRQVAIYVGKTSDPKRPLIRVWDLHTGNSLATEEERNVEALTADGPTLLGLGRYHLAIIPLGQLPPSLPSSSNAAWEALPHRQFLSALAEGTASRLHGEMRPSQSEANATTVTELPRSIDLEALADEVVPVSCVVGHLRVRSPDADRRFAIGIEHLERGILIGRYRRCLGSGLDATVSRVHLMLTSASERIVAIDTASTVGCYWEDREAHRRRPFSTHEVRGDLRMWLGKYSYVEWQVRKLR